jgi:hypothetical protein
MHGAVEIRCCDNTCKQTDVHLLARLRQKIMYDSVKILILWCMKDATLHCWSLIV